ncbi:hypothetical protein [Streptomyces sp. NPDC053431]|uniref:hypothetical protein n=1 Tax=Streptomyces sp. NPDC053431 TaxID=3365703 RepID=UPI0037CED9F6
MAEPGAPRGRERELAVLRGRIRDGARLVTLTGPPGAAKTRLIQEAVRHEDLGARWEPAGSLGPQHLPDLAGRLRQGLEDPAAPPLLVLDGWERLGRGGRALVAGLLREVPAAVPRLTVLVTALRPLYLEGEATVAVGPGSLRPGSLHGGSLRAGSLGAESSRPEFPRPEAPCPEAPRPEPAHPGSLGAEPACAEAARPESASPEPARAEPARRGDERPAVPARLARVAREAREAQGARVARAVRVAGAPGDEPCARRLAAAEQGYARCDRLERLLWERLSVFEGSFGREAVREVCASGTLPADAVLDVLDRLAPLALLPVDDRGSGEDRFWMPQPMRAVGARRLAARGDRRAVVLRHRRWYVTVARRAADWWHGGRQFDARDLALRELPDLAAAMDPTTAPLSPTAEADAAVEIAVSLWFLWVACGRVTEGRARLRHALSLHAGPAPARALWLAAYLELEAGRPEEADPLLVRAWAAAVREGDDRCLGMLAHLRGATALHQGRTEAAAAEFRDALAVTGEYPDLGPTRQLCRTALALALVRTDPEAAQEALDRAAEHSWAGRDVWADAWAQYARAELLYWEGETTRAADHATRALRGHLKLGTVTGAACAAELLAQMRILRGRAMTAAHLLGAVDLLRSDTFDDGYRPADFCAPGRARSETALRDRLSDGELRRAYAEGARRGLDALVREP